MKPTAADHDPVFDRLVARGLENETAASGRACPDADLLAAWFDRTLAPVEAARIEGHAASCGVCQQILADLARSEPAVTRAAPMPRPARPLVWHWRWLVPAVTVLVVVVVVGNRTLRAPTTLAPQAAVARPPAEAPAPPPAKTADIHAQAVASTPPRQASEPAAVAGAAARRDQLAAKKEDRPVPAAPQQLAAEEQRAAADNAAAQLQQRPAPSAKAAQNEPTPSAPPPAASGAALASPRPEVIAERGRAAGFAPPAAVGESVVVTRGAIATLLVTSRADASGVAAVWRLGEGGVIERSVDRGQTWEQQQTGAEAALLAGSAPSSTVCWLAGAGGIILKTSDGRTWQRITSPTKADIVSVRALSETTATVTTADRAEYTTFDGGATWRRR